MSNVVGCTATQNLGLVLVPSLQSETLAPDTYPDASCDFLNFYR